MSVAEKLLPHQVKPFEHLLDGFRRGLQCQVDFSHCGTGKTYVAAALAAELRWPVLVVCPYTVQSAWHRAAAHFNDEISVINYEALATGHSTFGVWERQCEVDRPRPRHLFCVACQRKLPVDAPASCEYHPDGIHCVEVRTSSIERGSFQFHRGVGAVFFDEVHRCSGMDSLNSDILIGAKDQGLRILGISATAAWSPLKLKALGYALGLHGNDKEITAKRGGFTYKVAPSFFGWSSGYGCRRHPAFRGWHWMAGADKQQAIMQEIREKIIPTRGVCISIRDIPGFPRCSVQPELFDLPEPDRKTAESLDALDRRAGPSDLQSPVVQRLRDRQRSELLAVSSLAEAALDKLEAGLSVAIFVNFQQTLDELGARLGIKTFLDGRTTGRARDQLVDRFVRDEDRIILVNTDAGGTGVSLPDRNGKYPRFGFVIPGEDAVDFKQLLHRLARADSVTPSVYKVWLAKGTIQEKVFKNLSRKLNNIDALTDGDLRGDG